MRKNKEDIALSDFDYEVHVWGDSEALIRIEERRHFCLGLKRFLEVIKNIDGRVMEIGCGTGIFLRSLKSYRTDLELSGCDISQKAIDLAKVNKQYNIDYRVAEAQVLPYDNNSFDIVVMMDVLEHLADVEAALREVKRVLKDRGMFHLLVPCEVNPLTLHWLMWKVKIGHNLKKKYAGHIQRLTSKKVRKLINDNQFSIAKETFSFHGLGQINDIFFDYLPRIFTKNKIDPNKRIKAQTAKDKIIRSIKERGLLLTFWLMLGRIIEVAAFYESEILKYFPGAIGLHITSYKGGLGENRN